MTKYDLQLNCARAKNNLLFTPQLICDQNNSPVSKFPPYKTNLHRKHKVTMVTIVLLFKLDNKYIYIYIYTRIQVDMFTGMLF